jgi:hypothetical protein
VNTILYDSTRCARRPHTCDQCGHKIEIGTSYRRQVYVDGGIQTYRAHVDCDAAALRMMDLGNYQPGYDDPVNLRNDLCPEDYELLLEEFPAVAGRFGIQGPVRPA